MATKSVCVKKSEAEVDSEESSEEGSANDAALDERLAAFGEAFLGCIDGGVRPLRRSDSVPKPGTVAAKAKSAQVSPLTAPADDAPPSSSKRKRCKRRRKEPAATEAKPDLCRPGPSCGVTPTEVASSGVTPASTGAPRPAGAPRLVAPPSRRGMDMTSNVSAAERRRFMSGDVSKIRSTGETPQPPSRRRKGKGGDSEEEGEEFKQILKEVRDFVIPNLGKEQQQLYEERRIRALGGVMNNQKHMNYKKMKDMRKRDVEERKKTVEEEKTLGVCTSASKHRKAWEVNKIMNDKQKRNKEKRKNHEDLKVFNLGMGAIENRGLVVIPRKNVKLYEKHAKGGQGGGGGKRRKR